MMRKSLLALAALAAFGLVLHGAPPEPALTAGLTAPAPDAGALDWLSPSMGYPYCGTTHGSTCYSPGARMFCQHQPGEPEMCVCQADYTWKCYW